ncbi:hypothetical protein [Enterococcus sp. BWR-S5]|uniref:hypothetical protein n=1 Tax=Enterococcus sp. BWR-S5 TaxID=2787714 RepID=UPI0019244416|nr:hypothetical protein [Enterococcus sp. BWR-S5]MBL1227052.1 hypothetical protein [Enterococcus sp. BWR-S5]
MINIIEEYEDGRITFEELSEDIHGYGERLISIVGEEKFTEYINLICYSNTTHNRNT